MALNRHAARLTRLEAARSVAPEAVIEARDRIRHGEPTDDLPPRAVELGRGLAEAIARAERALRGEPHEEAPDAPWD